MNACCEAAVRALLAELAVLRAELAAAQDELYENAGAMDIHRSVVAALAVAHADLMQLREAFCSLWLEASNARDDEAATGGLFDSAIRLLEFHKADLAKAEAELAAARAESAALHAQRARLVEVGDALSKALYDATHSDSAEVRVQWTCAVARAQEPIT